jgi:uncharacterized membrane protein
MEGTAGQSKAYGLVSRLQQPAWYWPLALLLAGFYVASSLYIASHRLLWYDEIFTAITTRLPDVRTIWKSLSESTDATPPLYFLITRIFDRMFRHADIALRIPSAIAFGVGLLVIFDIARRLTDGLYGLIAMAFLTTSFVTYYGYEARPYAIYFMLSSVALWLWVFTKDESKAGAVAFGAVFLIGVPIHYYFLLCLAPFGILALAQRRVFHLKVIAGAAGVMCSLALLYPQIASSRAAVQSYGSWAPQSLPKLQSVYVEFFPEAMVPMVLIAVGLAVLGTNRERVVTSMSSGERVCWLFLVVPLVTYVMARLVTDFFYNRYMIGAVPGIAVAVTCIFWRHCRESKYLSLALLILFGGFGIGQQVHTLRHIDHIPAFGDHQERTRQMLALEDTLRREGKSHFAIARNLPFLEAWYYSKHPEQYEFLAFGEPWLMRKYAPLKFVFAQEVVACAGQTAVIDPEPPMVEALERAGLHLKVRFAEPHYVLYLE